MDEKEIWLNVAVSCIQGVLEAKGGFLGEISPALAVGESFRIADEFIKQYKIREKDEQKFKDSSVGGC